MFELKATGIRKKTISTQEMWLQFKLLMSDGVKKLVIYYKANRNFKANLLLQRNHLSYDEKSKKSQVLGF